MHVKYTETNRKTCKVHVKYIDIGSKVHKNELQRQKSMPNIKGHVH